MNLKAYNIGKELILPAVIELICKVLHNSAFNIIRIIPLSNNTKQKRIDEMAQCEENVFI